jgi:hypothetical protein
MIALAGRGTPHPETTMLPSRFSCREPAAGTAPVSVLISFAAVRERPRRTGPGRSSRSQTALTCRERTPADLESVWGAYPASDWLASGAAANSRERRSADLPI